MAGDAQAREDDVVDRLAMHVRDARAAGLTLELGDAADADHLAEIVVDSGSGVPQYLLRLTLQSRASASQFWKRFVWTKSGTQRALRSRRAAQAQPAHIREQRRKTNGGAT